MCVVCGCGDTAGHPAQSAHPKAADDLHFGQGPARVSVPGLSQSRAIEIEQNVLGANDAVAARNRAQFASHGVAAFNLVSSPGSGKTTLLTATLTALRKAYPDLPLAVIEGDQQTSFDAERIRATGVPALQINTGKGCHLDAPMVAEAFERLHAVYHGHGHAQGHDGHHDHHGGHGHHHSAHDAHDAHDAHSGGILFIENVGNLVCPALWDLGEHAKVAVLSVTEGEDKPLKYPDMFAAAALMVVNKVDLLPHVAFDVARCREYARRVNPAIEIIELSATTGAGMDAWLHWLAHRTPTLAHSHHHEHRHDHGAQRATADELCALQQRVRELEAQLAAVKAGA